MEGKITTIEDLAALIMNTMASKEDIQGLASKEDIRELREVMNERFERVDTRLDHLDARVGRIEADIHDMSGAIVYRHEFEDALARIKYLEKKLGIESACDGVVTHPSPASRHILMAAFLSLTYRCRSVSLTNNGAPYPWTPPPHALAPQVVAICTNHQSDPPVMDLTVSTNCRASSRRYPRSPSHPWRRNAAMDRHRQPR